ncbi:MAG: DUF5723 family protein [Lepagella sp.]
MKKTIITGLALALASIPVMAQQEASRSGYFLDGYTHRHELNPALGGEYNYVSIPIFGNFNLGVNSNVGVNTFLYKLPNGQLTTFMNPNVDGQEFVSKLAGNNKVMPNLNLTIASVGFKALGGFNTISLSARVDGGVNVPKGLLEFMKMGQQGESSTYSFENLRVNMNASAEIALGHSHKINDKIDVGAKVKVLLGMGNLDARIQKMNMTLSDTQWKITGQGNVNVALGSGLYLPTYQEAGREYDNPSQADQISWDDMDYNSFSIAGGGAALDLGVVYRGLVPGLTLSASILDLGFMTWNNVNKGETPYTEWTFDGFKDIAFDEDSPNYEENKLDEQISRLGDDLEDCFNFRRVEDNGSRATMLATTIHIAGEYEMPFYKNLTAGLLLTQRINGAFSWTEGRLSANCKPTKWFDVSANYAISTFGSSFGWMINFHPKGFNFFIGSDHQFFNLTPQIVPVGHANANVTFGFNVTFGKS